MEISIKNLSNHSKIGRGCPGLTLRGDDSNALPGGFFPLFSFLGRFRSISQSLAGDELNEPKDNQLSTLWKDSVSRPLERGAIGTRNDRVLNAVDRKFGKTVCDRLLKGSYSASCAEAAVIDSQRRRIQSSHSSLFS